MKPVYILKQICKIRNLLPGTQIAVRLSLAKLHSPSQMHYYHHGVFLRDCKVIHFSAADAKLLHWDVLKFGRLSNEDNYKLYGVEHKKYETLDEEETLKRAEEVLEDPKTWPDCGNVHNYSSESLANWLTTGKSWSAQESKERFEVCKSLGASVTKCVKN